MMNHTAAVAAPSAVRPARRTRRVASAIGVALVGAIALAGCWSPEQGREVELINGTRAQARRAAVNGDLEAMNKAQAWAASMAARGVLEHTGGGSKLDTRGVSGWCAYAENVGRGPSLESIHNQFLASSVHYGNMTGSYDRVGTGVVKKGSTYWVVQIYLRSC